MGTEKRSMTPKPLKTGYAVCVTEGEQVSHYHCEKMSEVATLLKLYEGRRGISFIVHSIVWPFEWGRA